MTADQILFILTNLYRRSLVELLEALDATYELETTTLVGVEDPIGTSANGSTALNACTWSTNFGGRELLSVAMKALRRVVRMYAGTPSADVSCSM